MGSKWNSFSLKEIRFLRYSVKCLFQWFVWISFSIYLILDSLERQETKRRWREGGVGDGSDDIHGYTGRIELAKLAVRQLPSHQDALTFPLPVSSLTVVNSAAWSRLSLTGKNWLLTRGALRSLQTPWRAGVERSSSLWIVWGSCSSSGSTSWTRAQTASTSPTTPHCTRSAVSLWRMRGEWPEPVRCSSVLVRQRTNTPPLCFHWEKTHRRGNYTHSSSCAFFCLSQEKAMKWWFGTFWTIMDISLPQCTLSSARMSRDLCPSALWGRWKRRPRPRWLWSWGPWLLTNHFRWSHTSLLTPW